MIRSSKHSNKFMTSGKFEVYNRMLLDFRDLVNYYIGLIWDKSLDLKINLSSKDLPDNDVIKHSRWKQLAYKNASSVVRSVINRDNLKNYNKPFISNTSIELDERFWDEETDETVHFDRFIKISTPYFKDNSRNSEKICIPIKNTRISNKFKDWNQKKTIRLTINNIFFIYEKEVELKQEGKSLGVDIGYKNLLSDSDGNFYGDSERLYEKISRKKQGSKSFKKALKERDYEVNRSCKMIPFKDLKELYAEDLKNVKNGKRFNKKFSNKLQRWTYPKVLIKLTMLAEENGVLMKRVNPAYTSQTCHKCNKLEKSNRNGIVYSCCCGYTGHADINAAINILMRGTNMVSLDQK